jgi:Domain of unknown function (DUF4920)
MFKLKRFSTPLSILAIIALISCNKTLQTTASATKNNQSVTAQKDSKTFGEKITTKGSMSYDALLSKMASANKLEDVKVSGTVETVCQAKGCWMKIASKKGAPSMHVQFKDYAFFMPKDLAGKKVVMLGKVEKEVVSVENLRHFAADEGKSKEDIAKITQAKENITFVASGVLIVE